MEISELKEFLDEKVLLYENPKFIASDPIQIPHLFSLKEDIEIAAFLTATISWGNRKAILSDAAQMIKLMGESLFDFIMNYSDHDSDRIAQFYYRTFNGTDFSYFLQALRNIYLHHGGLEKLFTELSSTLSLQEAISQM